MFVKIDVLKKFVIFTGKHLFTHFVFLCLYISPKNASQESFLANLPKFIEELLSSNSVGNFLDF